MPRAPNPRFLYLKKDVNVRPGRTTRTAPTPPDSLRGPASAVSGWSLGEPDER
ncbi:hypothetical protein ACWDD9_43475 [Kitasatospora sp. NPDC001119]|uniref:hypothetical protein n=1 Tax=Kitasatospora sp. MY 5-36 TaxID=1678027 RepID=UPI000AAD2A6C|nr:hypothetical protein [Kitasatospora sp. MY 5-36]